VARHRPLRLLTEPHEGTPRRYSCNRDRPRSNRGSNGTPFTVDALVSGAQRTNTVVTDTAKIPLLQRHTTYTPYMYM
jgi:hypothetical protein